VVAGSSGLDRTIGTACQESRGRGARLGEETVFWVRRDKRPKEPFAGYTQTGGFRRRLTGAIRIKNVPVMIIGEGRKSSKNLGEIRKERG